MPSDLTNLAEGCIWNAPPASEIGQEDAQLRRLPSKSNATAYDSIISAVVLYHHDIFGCKQGSDKGHHFVKRRDSSFLHLYCYSCKNSEDQINICTFRVKARMKNFEAKIIEINLLHSCGGGGSERMRNISTKQIQALGSGAVYNYKRTSRIELMKTVTKENKLSVGIRVA